MKKLLVLGVIMLMLSACSTTENQKSAAPNGPSKFAVIPNDKPKLTITNWANEKVVILGNPKSGYLSKAKLIGGDVSSPHDQPKIYFENQPNEGLPNETYEGKTGTVVSDTNGRSSDGTFISGVYTVALDNGERVVTRGSDYLCPMSLLQRVKKDLEGKTVWAKGSFSLYALGDPPDDFPTTPSAFTIHPLDKLTISSVEPGVSGAQISIHIKSEDGREGCVYIGTGVGGGIAFYAFLHGTTECPLGQTEWDSDRFFHPEDPNASHRDWTADVWNSIKKGQVTVGMSEEMVSAACGPAFFFEAVSTTSSGGVTTTDWIHSCCPNQPRFAIAGGKVTKLVR